MLTIEEVDKWAKDNGYELYLTSAGGNVRMYQKQISQYLPLLCISINLSEHNMILTAQYNMVLLKAGEISFAHPKFKSIFEDQMVGILTNGCK